MAENPPSSPHKEPDVEDRWEDAPANAVPESTGHQRSRVTPLPMDQMIPMTFVLLNESICSTMLLPFVGLLVTHLKGIPAEEAGYDSGILIGVFMLGQMVSAKPWGWMSDKYGRRFPIISGLFTSGLMMLGFGLSTNVWTCAIFRFLHGLFNGNVLAAKTMMADITDRTNAAKGFAFVSLCYGVGVLIGPTLGGLLYDPAKSSAMRWAHITTNSIFSTRPALLPSLVIFMYTNIGMVICTFWVMESNPMAEPLPPFLKLLYPCFWRKAKLFVQQTPPRAVTETGEPASLVRNTQPRGVTGRHQIALVEDTDDGDSDDVMGRSIQRAETLVANVAMSRGVASIVVASPVLREGRRFDHMVTSETLTEATHVSQAVTPRYGRSTLGDRRLCSSDLSYEEQASRAGKEQKTSSVPNTERQPSTTEGDADVDGAIIVVTDERAVGSAASEASPAVLKRFGYKQAFAQPVTRTMLVLYMLLGAADMTVQEILPLWAIARTSVGGLGFGADMVGYLILTNSVPCVVSNLLFHRACTWYENQLILFRLSTAACTAVICVLPFISYVNLGRWRFPAVVLCTGVRQFFASWCYGLVTMLTARSAPEGVVGSIMGINQACGAMTRTIAPFVVTPLFAWSISSNHLFPFDHSFVFFLSSITFGASYVYSVILRTNADSKLEMVEEIPSWLRCILEFPRSVYVRLCGDAQRGE